MTAPWRTQSTESWGNQFYSEPLNAVPADAKFNVEHTTHSNDGNIGSPKHWIGNNDGNTHASNEPSTPGSMGAKK